MSAPTNLRNLKVGDQVVVTCPEFEKSEFSVLGEIVSVHRLNSGYKVRPMSHQNIKFSWGYSELRLPTREEVYRPSFSERLFESF